MKKRICAIAVVAICLSILASATYAYFTDAATARNVITSAGIDIEVVEQQLVNGVLQPYPDQRISVMPTSTVSKIVSVKNNEQPAWVRMNYSVSVYDADDNVMDITADELERVIIIEPDTVNWTQKGSWWYCNAAVNSGETTKPLFEEVIFSGVDMDNKYQGCTVHIDVNAQAVQTAHNGTNALTALGWTEE